jgi:hypothetical protein
MMMLSDSGRVWKVTSGLLLRHHSDTSLKRLRISTRNLSQVNIHLEIRTAHLRIRSTQGCQPQRSVNPMLNELAVTCLDLMSRSNRGNSSPEQVYVQTKFVTIKCGPAFYINSLHSSRNTQTGFNSDWLGPQSVARSGTK